jgi:hypothetical protein
MSLRYGSNLNSCSFGLRLILDCINFMLRSGDFSLNLIKDPLERDLNAHENTEMVCMQNAFSEAVT